LKIRLIIVVWGEDFVRQWTKFSLSSLLSPKNIPAIRHSLELDLWIPDIDFQQLKNTEEFIFLKKWVNINRIPLIQNSSNSYYLMNRCHQISIQRANLQNEVIGILSPDAIASDGLISEGIDKINSGYKAFLVNGPSARLEEVSKKLEKIKNGPVLKIKAKKLVLLWIKHMSELAKSHIVDKKLKILLSPSYFYFSNTSKSYLARQFHLHPLFVNPENKKVLPDGTFDLNYVEKSINNYKKIWINNNSDKGFYLELTTKRKKYGPAFLQQNFYEKVGDFINRSTWSFNRLYVWENILIRADNSKIKSKKVQQADNFIKHLFAHAFQDQIYVDSAFFTKFLFKNIKNEKLKEIIVRITTNSKTKKILDKIFATKTFLKLVSLINKLKLPKQALNSIKNLFVFSGGSLPKYEINKKQNNIFLYEHTDDLISFWKKNYKIIDLTKFKIVKVVRKSI